MSQAIRGGALSLEPVATELERIRQAAVAVILSEGAVGPELLIIKRADREGDPWSGHLAFPGGRAEPEDGHLAITATRETYEEIGLALDPEQHLIGRLETILPGNPSLPQIEIFPFVAAVRKVDKLVFSSEVEATYMIPIQTLVAEGLSDTVRIRRKDSIYKFPAYPSPGGPIWGITQRIITNLLELLR